jgi:PTH1 family peptidyl-tRNA hydrolase
MSPDIRKAVVGLGNPGPQYRRTRHNLGVLAAERFLERARARGQQLEPLFAEHALVYRVGEHLVVAKPLTYMNLSGLAVRELKERYNLVPQDFLIVYDDVMLPFGKLRARAHGGAGGHHGMESVIAALGTEEIPRLRLGIRREPLPDDLTEYVLSEFTPEEERELEGFLECAAQAIECFLQKGIEAVMNEFN